MDAFLMALKALAEPSRLRLFALCAVSELTVGELVKITGQSQPRISRHLRLLTEAGLLERYREGSHAFHRIRTAPTEKDSEGEGAAMRTLAATMVALLPTDDPVLVADQRRLADIKADHADAAAAYFRKNAARWNDLRSLHVDEAEVEQALTAFWPETSPAAYLDMGTGTGRMLELFAPRCERAVGLDQSREMLTIARATMERMELHNTSVRQGDLYHVPFDDDVFDAITLYQVLHFLDDPAHAIGEAARVLAPGGRLLVVDFAPHVQENLREVYEHRRLGFSDDEIVRWTAAGGLETLQVVHLPGNPLTVTVWMVKKPSLKETSSLAGRASKPSPSISHPGSQ